MYFVIYLFIYLIAIFIPLFYSVTNNTILKYIMFVLFRPNPSDSWLEPMFEKIVFEKLINWENELLGKNILGKIEFGKVD